jgi:hypothetical protein
VTFVVSKDEPGLVFRRLGHWGPGFVSDFEIRASSLA